MESKFTDMVLTSMLHAYFTVMNDHGTASRVLEVLAMRACAGEVTPLEYETISRNVIESMTRNETRGGRRLGRRAARK